MARKIKPLQLVEVTGTNFKSLADAQRAALPGLANDLGETLRALLAAGLLVNSNGRIIPNPERKA